MLLVLILGRFMVVGMPKILFNHLSSDGDESAYLSLGLALKEAGVLSDGTRPPLYSLLLTPFAGREWTYFTSAKLLTLGIGAVTVLALFGVGLRMFGWPTALLAAFLLAANKEFHVRSTTIYADVLLALIMIGAWYFLIKSVEGWKQSVWAGFFVGLAFLTKGSAPVLLAAWGLMALLHFRRSIFHQFHLLLVPLIFVIVSLPLLIYNANTFGSPTYNFATQHIMWMDRLEQINTADPAELPTAATYFATHTPADMVARMQKGLRRLNPVISRSVIPSRAFEPAWLGAALGLVAVVVIFSLAKYRRQAFVQYFTEHQNAYLFTLFLYALFYPFFTWYVAGSSAETRFVVPLLAPFYLLLADAVVTLLRGFKAWLIRSEMTLSLTVYRLVLVSAILLGVWWTFDTAWVERWALTVDPFLSDREANAEEEAMVQWLSRDNPSGAALISFGPSKSLPLWKFPTRFTIERLPIDVNSWNAMEAYVQDRRPAYIILDADTVRRRRQALSDYFQYESDRAQVLFENYPANWAFDLAYPEFPCRWCIFSPLANAPSLATFEGGIELLQWRVASEHDRGSSASISMSNSPATSHNSQFLRLILTWRTHVPPTADYTMFVHLTSGDGFVKTQHDRQPFDGLRPTSGWQPGLILADRYDLPLDDSLTPGEYLLLAGLYDPTTGERLAVVEGPHGPGPATVLLGAVRIE